MMPGTTVSVSAGQQRRLAFTLVELLVVIAIIGILIALLLPAVQAAREAARRSQCTNNLKQIGLALHNYHDTHKCFPPGVVRDTSRWQNNPTTNSTNCLNIVMWGWSTLILPFVEEKPLYDALDVDSYTLQGVMNGLNAAVPDPAATLATPIEGYRCPSSKSAPTNSDANRMLTAMGGSPSFEVGTLDYPGNAGMARRYFWENWGPLEPADAHSFDELTDGTSNIFFVGERDKDSLSAVWPGARCATLAQTGEIPNNQYDSAAYQLGTTWWRMNRPDRENVGYPGTSTGPVADYDNESFASKHPDGANFLLCDGSVHFISELIESNCIYISWSSPRGTGFVNWNRTWEEWTGTPPALVADCWKAVWDQCGVYQYLSHRSDGAPIDQEF